MVLMKAQKLFARGWYAEILVVAGEAVLLLQETQLLKMKQKNSHSVS